jgi:hypothetical protein
MSLDESFEVTRIHSVAGRRQVRSHGPSRRVLRIARTLADLAGSEPVRRDHVDEAIFLRSAITDGGVAA